MLPLHNSFNRSVTKFKSHDWAGRSARSWLQFWSCGDLDRLLGTCDALRVHPKWRRSRVQISPGPPLHSVCKRYPWIKQFFWNLVWFEVKCIMYGNLFDRVREIETRQKSRKSKSNCAWRLGKICGHVDKLLKELQMAQVILELGKIDHGEYLPTLILALDNTMHLTTLILVLDPTKMEIAVNKQMPESKCNMWE